MLLVQNVILNKLQNIFHSHWLQTLGFCCVLNQEAARPVEESKAAFVKSSFFLLADSINEPAVCVDIIESESRETFPDYSRQLVT